MPGAGFTIAGHHEGASRRSQRRSIPAVGFSPRFSPAEHGVAFVSDTGIPGVTLRRVCSGVATRTRICSPADRGLKPTATVRDRYAVNSGSFHFHRYQGSASRTRTERRAGYAFTGGWPIGCDR